MKSGPRGSLALQAGSYIPLDRRTESFLDDIPERPCRQYDPDRRRYSSTQPRGTHLVEIEPDEGQADGRPTVTRNPETALLRPALSVLPPEIGRLAAPGLCEPGAAKVQDGASVATRTAAAVAAAAGPVALLGLVHPEGPALELGAVQRLHGA